MASNSDWLERLQRASDYQQLQSVFFEMVAESRVTDDGARLAESIDEAIRRIEQERARDQSELETYEQQYAEFKSQQGGVVGWFKRHLPFTETRREDRRHRDAVADQSAEILADNLIIARAQMLKQGLLPPQSRQLGFRPDQWRARLLECESTERIKSYGDAMTDLSHELTTSKAFANEVRQDIDAFSHAVFLNADDRHRQQKDVEAARNELAVLETEIEQERQLLDSSIKRAGELVTDELSQHDREFHQLLQRVDQLQRSARLAKTALESGTELSDLFTTLGKLSQEADSFAHKHQQIDSKAQRLREDLQASQGRLDQAQQQLSGVAIHHDQAKTRADQADAAVAAAKRIYDQHRAAISSEPDHVNESTDPVYAEFHRLEKERDAADAALRIASGPYDLAKSQLEEMEQQSADIESEIRSLCRKHEKIADKEKKTAKKLQETADKIPRTLRDFEPKLNEYLRDRITRLRLSRRATESRFPRFPFARSCICTTRQRSYRLVDSAVRNRPRHQTVVSTDRRRDRKRSAGTEATIGR